MHRYPRFPGRPSLRAPILRAVLVLLLVGLGACSTSRRTISPEAGAARLALAEEALARGELNVGVRELVALRQRRGLTPSLRERAENTLLDTGTEEIEAARGNARALRRIYDSKYPERIRVRAGLLSAEALFDAGRPVDAFTLLQKIDREYPHHPERALAGNILGRIGLHLIERKGRYSLIFRYRTKGIRALEYLVLRYPLDSHCDDAYYALSQRYEKDNELDYALERIEDLLIYHPSSPYAIAAQARLPYLRLRRLERNDYDRGELAVAQQEIDNWLGQHQGHELEAWVLELAQAAAMRLAESDLSLARYYERIDSDEGRQLHARRALEIARRANLEGQVADARRLLFDASAETNEPALALEGVKEAAPRGASSALTPGPGEDAP